MFSKRSVSVHPDAPHSEYAGVPDAFSVPAAFVSAAHVFGGVTPAFLKDRTLYQYNDLFAALNGTAYWVPLTWPSLRQDGPKFDASTPFAYAMDLSFPGRAYCFSVPGCCMAAMA